MPRTASDTKLLTVEEITEEFPLHMLVWRNNAENLKEKLAENKVRPHRTYSCVEIIINFASQTV